MPLALIDTKKPACGISWATARYAVKKWVDGKHQKNGSPAMDRGNRMLLIKEATKPSINKISSISEEGRKKACDWSFLTDIAENICNLMMVTPSAGYVSSFTKKLPHT